MKGKRFWSIPPVLMLSLTSLGGCGTRALAPKQQDDSEAAAETAAPVVPTKIVAAGCSRAEKPIFICKLKDGDLLSVCATGGTGPAYAQYRIGKPGHAAKLTIPTKAGGTLPKFASVPYSGGGEAQMAFTSGSFSYIVYSRVIRTNFEAGKPNNPKFEDGVMVVKGGKLVKDQQCVGEAKRPLDYNLALQYGQKINDIFYPN